jgi:hypothetical protein
MEGSLLTLLPDVYEGIDMQGVVAGSECKSGAWNTQKCYNGQYFDSCGTGACFKG